MQSRETDDSSMIWRGKLSGGGIKKGIFSEKAKRKNVKNLVLKFNTRVRNGNEE